MSGGPWIGPTVEDTLRKLREAGNTTVLIQPIGFLCDHVEILYDIDIGFREVGAKLGMRVERAESLNDSPTLISALADLAQSATTRLAARSAASGFCSVKKRIAIVGGGISGLTAAYILHRDYAETCDFTLFEANSRLGGIIETVRAGGFTIECGPDSWVTEKPWAEQLVRELGLGDELLPSSDHARRTYIARGESLVPLPTGMRMMVPTDLDAVHTSPLFSRSSQASLRSRAHAGRGASRYGIAASRGRCG